jgi:3-oxoacyl-[acyl-carrier-protein] synthase-3
MNARILGIGRHVPERIVTNDDLAKVMDTTDEWIQQRTGIRQRHFISADAGPADLALPAVREALADARVDPQDLDLVLLGTLSPDVDFPNGAALLLRHLGLRGVPAMDVRNQCSGFVYMLAVADKFIRTGGARRVLVVGAETGARGRGHLRGRRGRRGARRGARSGQGDPHDAPAQRGEIRQEAHGRGTDEPL